MPLFHAVIILAVIGLAVWAIVTYIPMNAGVKRAIIVVTIICVVFWLLKLFGILGELNDIKVPQLR